MASKKAAADEAYRRAEAQRALVVVLEAAEYGASDGPNSRAADFRAAIDTVREHYLKVSEPKPRATTLKGQLDIDGSVEGEPAQYDPTPIQSGPLRGVPSVCPRCGRNNGVIYGCGWTSVKIKLDDLLDLPMPGEQPQLQCGACAYVLDVSFEVWEKVRQERQRTIGASDKVERALKEPKTRGAG